MMKKKKNNTQSNIRSKEKNTATTTVHSMQEKYTTQKNKNKANET